MTRHSPSQPRLSRRHDDWVRALQGGDVALLRQLAASDEPAAALLELETYINGLYRGSLHPLALPRAEIETKVARVSPLVQEIRDRLGWRVRELDLALLRLIRRSSALSAVIGAGVSMGAGAPSWACLVRLLLEETLERGLELRAPVPAAGNPERPPIEPLPDGSVRLGTGTWRCEHRVREVKRYTTEQESRARQVLREVRAKGDETDVETLMTGAQVCHDLCGQELFRLLTGVIYSRAQAPSETHRAIARLAHAQPVPERGPGLFPGWDSIITYNFDALMTEALAEAKVPHAAWGMTGDQLAGDPDALARDSDWHQAIFHLHGYTPRRLFRITDVRYVFSTSQFRTVYGGPPPSILRTVFEEYLANPVHVALYIGCSFADRAMNDLLRDAVERFPGRYHYALMKWPHDRKGAEPNIEEIKAEAARYLEIGVRPIWFDDFPELPELIGRLQ